jgi:DNA-directed RNA polymerase specialized sigma24 family protein
VNIDQRWQLAQVAYASKIHTAAVQSSYVSRDHDVEDMEQELLVCLWECCSMYDPERGAIFNTFFWMRARQRIGQVRARQRTAKRGGGLDIIHVDLDDDTIANEVSQIIYAPSAEDECIAWEEVRERGRVTA